MKRPHLTKRFAGNVKASRAEVNHEIISHYFDNLQKRFKGKALDNIFNYYKTNVTDGHGRKMVIVLKGENRVERKTHNSKLCTSVMFCRNATRNFLLPVVVYK